MTSSPETTEKIDQNKAFWSAWLVFLLGAPVAALNWWRMGKKNKGFTFLGVSIVIDLLVLWLQAPLSDFDLAGTTDFLIVFPFFVVALFQLILAFLIRRDVKTFTLSGAKPLKVHWSMIFPFLLSTVLLSLGIMYGADAMAQNTKYCQFPRFQDLLYDNMLANRSGLQSTLINHYDWGCNIALDGESKSTAQISTRTPSPSNTVSASLVGHQKSISDSSILIAQTIEQYQEPVTQAMVETAVNEMSHSGSAFEIKLDNIKAEFFNYRCGQGNHQYKYCLIGLGYTHSLTLVQVAQDEYHNIEFERLLAAIIQKVDQRMVEYDGQN